MNLIEEYRLHLVKSDRSEKTIHGYTTDLAQFQKWLGAKPLTAITEVDVRSYRDHMLKQGHSPNTINRRISSLASFGDWGVQDGVFKRNPAQYVKPVKVMELAPRWLNEEQKKKLLAVVEHDLREARERYPRLWVLRKRDAVIVHTLLLTGLRVDELCSLALSDLTLSERKGTLLVRHGKGGKQRVVMLMNETRKQLGEWLAVRPQVEGDALFVGQTGEGIRPRLVQRLVERYSKMAGLEGVTPHSLRHLLQPAGQRREAAGGGEIDGTRQPGFHCALCPAERGRFAGSGGTPGGAGLIPHDEAGLPSSIPGSGYVRVFTDRKNHRRHGAIIGFLHLWRLR